MENHPSYTVLKSLALKYPEASGCLFQTYNDIFYAQSWEDVTVVELEACSRGAIRGRRANTTQTLNVVPCAIHELVSFAWLRHAFEALDNPEDIYLAITSDDASLVYYKISRGIIKPPV